MPRKTSTLAIDIGASVVKAAVLNEDGGYVAPPVRSPTPTLTGPPALLKVIDDLVAELPAFLRVSVGFPGVVKRGRVITAPNLGAGWSGFDLEAALRKRFRKPVRVLNDALVHGLGLVEGKGLECVLTFGTGVGCGLFRDGKVLLGLEIGEHTVSGKQTYDHYAGQAGLQRVGRNRWNRRVERVVDAIQVLTACDLLHLGGGNARLISFDLPAHVRLGSNDAGLNGGLVTVPRRWVNDWGRNPEPTDDPD